MRWSISQIAETEQSRKSKRRTAMKSKIAGERRTLMKNKVAPTGLVSIFAAALMQSIAATAQAEDDSCSLARAAGTYGVPIAEQ
jgi:hypothetical protein